MVDGLDRFIKGISTIKMLCFNILTNIKKMEFTQQIYKHFPPQNVQSMICEKFEQIILI
jgi:hypothetical protein